MPADVVIEGLKSRPDLNGKRGRAIELDVKAGRYHIVMEQDGEEVALRVANVRAAGGDASSTARDAQQSQFLSFDVRLVHDQKRISVMSMTQLRNETSAELNVRIFQPLSGTETVHPLPPGEMLPLPLRQGGGAYQLCLKPAAHDVEWCEYFVVPSVGADESSAPLECRARR